MKVTINAHVHAKKAARYCADTEKYSEVVEWELYPFDMSGTSSCDRVLVGVQQVEVEIPEGFDVRDGLVRNLEAEKKRLMGEFQARVTAIDNQIQKYLAIENKPTVEA
jgi:hypothetical protein